jgi:hypothetical protein
MSAGRLGKTERLRQRMPMRAYFAPLDATMSLYGEVTATSRSTYVSGSTIFYPVNTEASSMIISSPLFEAYLECATKCWLRSRAEPSAGNVYTEWVHLQDHIYYENGLKRLLALYPEGQREVAPSVSKQNKDATWRIAIDLCL